MTLEQRNKLKRVLGMIIKDCEDDAMSLEGQPFTGPVVAKRLGEIYATMQAIAKIVDEHLEQSFKDSE